MNLTIYRNAGQFLNRAQTYLEAREAINSLMLGVCLRHARFPERIVDPPYLATVDKGYMVDLAAMLTPPYNLVLASDGWEINFALELVADDLISHNWQVPGVTARKTIARAFAELWCAKTGQRFDLEMSQRIYECRGVIPPVSVPGSLRQATIDELEMVTRWMLAFWEETFPTRRFEPETVLDQARAHINDGDIYIWEHDLPVSMAGKSRPTTHGVSISLVFTPQQFRCKGYAAACVAKLTQTLFDSGCKFCALYTDLANPTSNSIYKRIGYNPIQNVNSYLFSDFDAYLHSGE